MAPEEWSQHTHAIIIAPYRQRERPAYVAELRNVVEAGRQVIRDAQQALLDGAAEMMDRAINPGGMLWSVNLDTTLEEADSVLHSLWIGLREPTVFLGDAVALMPDLGRTFVTRTTEVMSVRRRLPPRASAASPGATPDVGVAGTGHRPTIGGTDTDWREVQARLLGKRERGEPYTSLRKLAGEIGCSDATIRKAIDESESLLGWRARSPGRKSTPKATDLAGVVLDNARQTAEPAPDDFLPQDDVDATIARLIEHANADERAKLNALDDAGRRKLVATYHAHNMDEERSPMEPDKPGERVRKVTYRKRA
jgi:hypothetical protein